MTPRQRLAALIAAAQQALAQWDDWDDEQVNDFIEDAGGWDAFIQSLVNEGDPPA